MRCATGSRGIASGQSALCWRWEEGDGELGRGRIWTGARRERGGEVSSSSPSDPPFPANVTPTVSVEPRIALFSCYLNLGLLFSLVRPDLVHPKDG